MSRCHGHSAGALASGNRKVRYGKPFSTRRRRCPASTVHARKGGHGQNREQRDTGPLELGAPVVVVLRVLVCGGNHVIAELVLELLANLGFPASHDLREFQELLVGVPDVSKKRQIMDLWGW